MSGPLRRARALAQRLAAVEASLTRQEEARAADRELLSQLTREFAAERAAASERAQQQAAEAERLRAVLQLLYDREPEMRGRLAALRASAEYEQAYRDPEPLVSVVIATYDRGDLLASRALPSVLEQTYQRFEILVVGDAAPPRTAQLIDALGDPRIQYRNLERRGPYPDDPRGLWHVGGVPPRNAAVAGARGSWIAPLDDDDAFHPDHLERLVAHALATRCEVAYGALRCRMRDGSEFQIGTFPPDFGQFGWQGAIFHAGLRLFEMELADALFGSPADWSLCRRMLRAGVRFGMVEGPVVDHFESRMRGT